MEYKTLKNDVDKLISIAASQLPSADKHTGVPRYRVDVLIDLGIKSINAVMPSDRSTYDENIITFYFQKVRCIPSIDYGSNGYKWILEN